MSSGRKRRWCKATSVFDAPANSTDLLTVEDIENGHVSFVGAEAHRPAHHTRVGVVVEQHLNRKESCLEVLVEFDDFDENPDAYAVWSAVERGGLPEVSPEIHLGFVKDPTVSGGVRRKKEYPAVAFVPQGLLGDTRVLAFSKAKMSETAEARNNYKSEYNEARKALKDQLDEALAEVSRQASRADKLQEYVNTVEPIIKEAKQHSERLAKPVKEELARILEQEFTEEERNEARRAIDALGSSHEDNYLIRTLSAYIANAREETRKLEKVEAEAAKSAEAIAQLRAEHSRGVAQRTVKASLRRPDTEAPVPPPEDVPPRKMGFDELIAAAPRDFAGDHRRVALSTPKNM